MHILLIEDQSSLAEFVQSALAEHGHDTDVATSLEHARELFGGIRYDLLLADRMLPDGDGIDFVREIRVEREDIPVIFLTARDQVQDRVEGLRVGADDYLVKPFAVEELAARIEAVTRRLTGGQVTKLHVSDLHIDLVGLRVERSGKVIRLTAQEFRLLRYMAESAGCVLSRGQLLEHVWGVRHDPGTNVVDVYISYLRKKIDRGFTRRLVHTVRGLGYVLEDRA